MAFDPSPLRITCDDGIELAASRFCGGTRAAMLIAPALGVPRRFYDRYAQFFAGHGYDVLSIDYRGVGESAGAERGASLRLADSGRLDLDAALRWLWEHSPAQQRVFVGHSLGGQLPGLAPQSESLAAMIAIGASCPDPRLYPIVPRLRMRLLWRVLVPLLSRGREQFPARRIGFSSIDVPSGPMRDWARWGLSPGYLFDPRHGLDTQRYATLAMPLLAYSFADDDYAVRPAVEALLARYPAARTDHRHIGRPREGRIGHFGYFHPRMRDSLWTDTLRWLDTAL
ncbi:MAG: alpha/beta fold hydrolase [Sinimarinibacterium flocculans]|uniref:alpha/beta hydrolase family protein n=1 Tax=Sinimarinibacterium flocculans TaxID=985250 RepID=UPI003C586661